MLLEASGERRYHFDSRAEDPVRRFQPRSLVQSCGPWTGARDGSVARAVDVLPHVVPLGPIQVLGGPALVPLPYGDRARRHVIRVPREPGSAHGASAEA